MLILIINVTIAKIETYLVKSFGVRHAQQIKNDNPKRKDMMRTILIKELNKTYKYPEAVLYIFFLM